MFQPLGLKMGSNIISLELLSRKIPTLFAGIVVKADHGSNNGETVLRTRCLVEFF